MIKLSGHQKHHSKRRKRRSRTLIHVTIRPSRNSLSKKNNCSNHPHYSRSFGGKINTQSIIHNSIKLSNATTYYNPTTITNYHQHNPPLLRQKKDDLSPQSQIQNSCLSRPSTVILYQTKETWANSTDYRKEYNRNCKKKNKFVRYRCLIVTLITISILIATIVTVSTILLTKPNTRRKPVITPVLRWNSTAITIAGGVGISSTASDKLSYPEGLAIDYQNTLYISDANNNRVQKYLFGSSMGITVAGYANGTPSSLAKGLSHPETITLNSNGSLCVADTYNNRIQLWIRGASSGVTIGGTGIVGSLNNQLNMPHDVSYDLMSGILYVADFSNHRVMSYLPGNTSGTVVAGGNSGGKNTTQLNSPPRLYFDLPSNSLFTINYYSHNVVRWKLGERNWTIVAGDITGSSGNTATLLYYPSNVKLDPVGNVCVADGNNHRIQLFPIGQSNGITIAGVTGRVGNNSTLLNAPQGIVLDNQLNLYVADTNNHRIQKFLRY